MQTGPINPAGPSGPQSVGGTWPARRGEKAGGGDFKKMLEGYLDDVNNLQHEADKAVADLARGRIDNLHQVVAAVNEADLSFRLMMQMRNKLVDAYKEIMRMQV